MYDYERFRLEFATSLDFITDSEQRNMILSKLDNISYRYNISYAETSLTTCSDQVKYIMDLYESTRRLSGFSEATIYVYKSVLKNFFNVIKKSPKDIVANDVRMYLYYLKNTRKLSDRTIEGYRNYLLAFFRWTYNEGLIDRDPCMNVDKIKYVRNERKSMTKMEVEIFRRSCNDTREIAIVDTFLSTGCRVSEMRDIKLSDIDWDERSIKVIGKGKKPRIVYINSKSELSIKKYLETRNDNSEYLFVTEKSPHGKICVGSYRIIIARISDEANLGYHVTPHILRHTFATQALASGMSIEIIQKLLGHADIRTTTIYAKVLKEDIKNAHNKYVN